ncbi:MAG: adenosylcobinamide-GDP ribazoletransferase [Marmoricola sp.]
MRDGWRLALGTLTVLPCRPPRVVDRRTASWAMTLAPVVGLLLGALVLAALVLLRTSGAPPVLQAVLVLGLLVLLTRALHLDGLADTTDGLGSRRPASEALQVMRRGDIGPFGVLSLVFALAVQIAALSGLAARHQADRPLVIAIVLSRGLLPVLCRQGIPAARGDGLGSVVAGVVGPGRLALSGLLTAGALAAGLSLVRVADASPPPGVLASVVAGAVGLAAGMLLCRRAVGRLGGVTGDVLGACVEVTATVVLLGTSLAAGAS